MGNGRQGDGEDSRSGKHRVCSEQGGFPGGSEVKNHLTMQETRVPSLGREDPLEEGMGTHSGILAWEAPWTEEPGEPGSMGLQSGTHGTAERAHTIQSSSEAAEQAGHSVHRTR